MIALQKILVLTVALFVATGFAGCLQGETNELQVSDPAGASDPMSDADGTDGQKLTYEPIETVRVNFPFGPSDPPPAGPAVAVPDNTAALKFEISWHSTTGNMIWSSYTPPPPAAKRVAIQLVWSDGGHATTIAMSTSSHIGDLDPGGAFETQTKTLTLDSARGGTLDVSPTGWGDLWAIVHVSAGHA